MLSGSSSNVEAGQTVTIIFAGKTSDHDGRFQRRLDLHRTGCRSERPEGRRRQRTGQRHQRERQRGLFLAGIQRRYRRASGHHQHHQRRQHAECGRGGAGSDPERDVYCRSRPDGHRGLQRQSVHRPVQANGSWTLDVPAADMAGIADGSAAVTVTVSDKAGNPASAGASVLVDTTVPQITFDIVAGDDIVNIAEHGRGADCHRQGDGRAGGRCDYLDPERQRLHRDAGRCR